MKFNSSNPFKYMIKNKFLILKIKAINSLNYQLLKKIYLTSSEIITVNDLALPPHVYFPSKIFLNLIPNIPQ